MNLKELAHLLTKTPQEIFGDNPESRFRELSTIAHPDFSGSAHLFSLLNTLYNSLNTPPTIIESKKRSYEIKDVFVEGDISTLFRCSNVVLKITRSPHVKLDNERNLLRKIGEIEDSNEIKKLSYYYLNLVDAFTLPDGRSCDVFEYNDSLISLENLRELPQYKNGLELRHVAWIFKRCLAALHITHYTKTLHGAMLPSHILVNPSDHGAKLIGLNHSYDIEQKQTTISPKYESFYPLEVFDKKDQNTSTDIYTLAESMKWLLGDYLKDEKRARIFLNALTIKNVKGRIEEAMKIHWEWDELLRDLFGPPKFHHLVV